MRVRSEHRKSGRMRQRAGMGALLATGLLLLGACATETPSVETDPPTAAPTAAPTDAPTDAPDLPLMGSTPDRQLTVAFQDIAFAPAELNIAAGEVVELQVENVGALTHDFTIEHIDAEVAMQHEPAQHAPAGHDAHGDAAVVHLALAAGDRMVARLRVHEPGEYAFYCAEPGHREAGMVGTLIVQ
jgi:uncharacterized cupredoxin-like copper-binding protein